MDHMETNLVLMPVYNSFCRIITKLILQETKSLVIAERQCVRNKHVRLLASFMAEMQMRTEPINNGKATLLFKMSVNKCSC